MLTLEQFENEWAGHYISLLKPGKQCFDVVAAWTDNLGIPHAPSGLSPFPFLSAYQIYFNFGSFQSQYFTQIPNGPLNAPQAGDIIVFKPDFNSYYKNGIKILGDGHCGIATGRANLFNFDIFEQNDPLGGPCQIKTYGYGYLSPAGIYGWLHPKILDIPVLTPEQKYTQIIHWANDNTIPDSDFRYKVLHL